MASVLFEAQMNDGRVTDFKCYRGLNEQYFEMIASAYCEGSPALKSLLLSLWSQGIDTIACCRGHEDPHEAHSHATKDNVPYVAIIARNIPAKDLIAVTTRIREKYNDDVVINCVNNCYNEKEMVLQIEFKGAVKDWSKIDITRENFFKMLQDEISCIKTVESESDYNYKSEIVKGLLCGKPNTINVYWEEKSQGTVCFSTRNPDEKGSFYLSMSIDSLKNAFPQMSETIAEFNNGSSSRFEFTYTPEDEIATGL